MLARHVLYHLIHAPSSSTLVIFQIRSCILACNHDSIT
jgi:hypothetical protein